MEGTRFGCYICGKPISYSSFAYPSWDEYPVCIVVASSPRPDGETDIDGRETIMAADRAQVCAFCYREMQRGEELFGEDHGVEAFDRDALCVALGVEVRGFYLDAWIFSSMEKDAVEGFRAAVNRRYREVVRARNTEAR